jgi:PilZ domain-containing protein
VQICLRPSAMPPQVFNSKDDCSVMGQAPETLSSTVGPGGTNSAERRRRSQRVQIAIPVLVRGKSGSQPFDETAQTILVSAHGCMVRLSATVVRAQPILIVNAKTAEEMPCEVAFVGKKDAEGKADVGISFAELAPLFWKISFPPEDWNLSERKLPGAPRQPAKPVP